MPQHRDLNPRFRSHIARKRRTRLIAGSILGLCLLATSAAALSRTSLPQHLANLAPQLPPLPHLAIPELHFPPIADSQLAASATSFPNYIADKARNLFCRWLGCETSVAIESTPQPPQRLNSQPDTPPQNVKPPALDPTTRSATTTSQVVVSNSSPLSNASVAPSVSASPTQFIQHPVIERVRETVRTIVQGGIDEAFLDARLAALERDLSGRLNQVALAGAYQTNRTYDVLADALRIEELTDLILHSPVIDGATITGGSITAASISGTLSNAISSALATITALTSTTITATNASTTVASSLDGLFVGRTSTTTILGSATSTFGAGIQTTALNVTSSEATSTFVNGIRLSGGCFQLADGTCAGTGSGGGLTFGKSWEVSGSFLAPTSTLYVTNIQQASSTIFSANRAWFGSTATTTIDTAGNVAVAGTLDVTGKATLGNASTTNLSASYASSTSGFFGSLSVAALSGFLKATAGAIATAAIDLASDVTGILGVTRGGTGWANVAAGAVPYGNGSSALATTTAGTPGQVLALLNGVPTWAATTTLSTISGTQLDGVFASNGLLARTTTGTYASRTLTGTSNQITVTNGDGVSGNPTFSLSSLLFITNASSTQQSIFDRLYVGGSATTTIRGDGIASTIPFASSTMISATTASSTNLWISSVASGSLLKTSTGGSVIAAVAGTDYAAASSIFGKSWEVSGNFLAPTTTNYVTNIQQASSTVFSALNASFGALTATSSLTVLGPSSFANSANFFGLTSFGATATTTISAAGTISTPSIIATNATSTSLFATNAAASTASFGATATSTFTSTGFLGIGTTTPGSALSIQGNIFLAGNLVSTSTVASIFPYASTTALTVSGTASTTNLIVSSAGGTTGCAQFSVTGLISNTGSACGSGSAAFPFTPTLNFGANTNATSTALSLFGGLNASSTIRFGNAGVSGFLFDSTTGNLGLGTTTPWGLLSINPNGITGPSFVIGSSTATNFIVTNGGNVGIGTTTPNYALDVNGDVNVAAGKCFRVNGVCIGYTVKLAAIYATSSVGTTTVVFTGAQGAAPSFSAAALTLPSNTSHYVVEVWGGGGGGGAVATNNGAQGGTTCYSNNATACVSVLLSATGGGGGAAGDGTGGAGGSGSAGDVNMTGGGGGGGSNDFNSPGHGGSAPGGGGGGKTVGNLASADGSNGSPFGGGGSGGYDGSTSSAGGGGGGYSRELISNTTSATFTVGAGGAGGAAGTRPGGAGGAGGVVITVYATSSPNAAGNDYAEMFPVSNPGITAGDIVAVDVGVPVSMKLAEQRDNALAGVISTAPGELLGDKNAAGERPVALAGRVPVKVNLEGGPINIGDRIAPSSVPGVGKKAGPFDNSVGIVIDNVQPDGTVMIFLDLHQGIDINAIAFGLLGNDAFAVTSSSSPSTSSTTIATGPLDFVGGMMRAFASRLSLFTFVGSAASSTATTTDATSTPPAPPTDSYVVDLMHAIFSSITAWLAAATNGIQDFYAGVVHATTGRFSNELCVGTTCVDQSQLAALLALVASSTPQASGGSAANDNAPQATLTVNGNDPAQLNVGESFADLGALFTHDSLLETVTSTSTVDTTKAGTTTLDYWAVVPSTQAWLHATRAVVVSAPDTGAAKDNPPPTANDDAPVTANDNSASTTSATSTSQ